MVEQVNAGDVEIESSKGGTIAQKLTYNGNTVFKITNAFRTTKSDHQGQQCIGRLRYEGDPVTFLSSTYIDIYHLYNNQVFKNSTDFNQVTGRIVNYTGTSGLTISLNGNTRDLSVNGNGEFSFTDLAFLRLIPESEYVGGR